MRVGEEQELVTVARTCLSQQAARAVWAGPCRLQFPAVPAVPAALEVTDKTAA